MKRLFCLLLLCFCFSLDVNATVVRETDVKTPSSGNVMVNISGEFKKVNVTAILNQINGYRKEACQKGYPDPRNRNRKLQPSDYFPVKWSGDLEEISLTRAAESAVSFSHTRPNGNDCFSLQYPISIDSETLVGSFSPEDGIEGWYSEKEDWLKNTGRETGHYTIMISPYTKYIAVSSFCVIHNGEEYGFSTAGVYSYENNLGETPHPTSGMTIQKMEVKKSYLQNPIIEGPSKVSIYQSASFSAMQYVRCPNIFGELFPTPILISAKNWNSSNPAIASISNSGKLTTYKEGATTISVSLEDGTTLKKTITVTPPTKGKQFTVGNVIYKIKKQRKEVEYYRTIKKSANVIIPSTVSIEGHNYIVSKISDSAFYNNKKLKKITIGKNIKNIGKKAFYGCSNLKTIIIPSNVNKIGSYAFSKCSKLKKPIILSKNLTKNNVGSNAFSKTKIKIVKCPKGKKKTYKKFFYKKGVRMKAKFK